MKKIRLTLSIGALLFALIVLFISLISTNQVISYEDTATSRKRFYIGQTILPDHTAYPLVAAVDQILLLVAPSQKKISLKLTYGQIRMDYAQALMAKDEPSLTHTALTKSQKYLSSAALQVLEDDFANYDLKQEVARQLELNIEQATCLIRQLAPSQTTMAQQLNQNNKALLEKFN